MLYSPEDPIYDDLADILGTQPPCSVSLVTLDPEFRPVLLHQNAFVAAPIFSGPRVHCIVLDTGEYIYGQDPKAFADAVLEDAQLPNNS